MARYPQQTTADKVTRAINRQTIRLLLYLSIVVEMHSLIVSLIRIHA